MQDANAPLIGLSVLTALIYGFVLTGRPPSLIRTAIKTAGVGAIAVVAFLSGAPVWLAAGLLLCAAGDAFLAADRRWLPAGLGLFLLGHLFYIFLFQEMRDPALEMTPIQIAAVVAVGVAAFGMLAWLWTSLGPMRAAVTLYVVAIAVMVGSSALLPALYWPAIAGAAAFMASDAILAGDLFREARLLGSQRLTGWAVWFLYYGGQAAIAWAFLRQPF